MTTTQLIQILKSSEFDANGRSKEIEIYQEGDTFVLDFVGNDCVVREITFDVQRRKK